MTAPAALAVTRISRAGINLTDLLAAVDGTNGNTFVNTGREAIAVKNASVTPLLVTIALSETVDGQALASKTVTVAAGKTDLIGPFPPSVYGVSPTITFDSGVTITAAVVQLVAELN